jgi:hypothetical protein
MDDSADRDNERNFLVKAWHEYGLRFSMFAPAHQPAPTTWEPDVKEFDAKGRVNPQYLKHWKFLPRSKDFPRERYAKHHIFEVPTRFFDFLVRKFRDRMS